MKTWHVFIGVVVFWIIVAVVAIVLGPRFP